MKDKTVPNARQHWFLSTVKDLKLENPVVDIQSKTGTSIGAISNYLNSKRFVTFDFLEKFCKGFELNYDKAKEQIQRIADASINKPTDNKHDENQQLILNKIAKKNSIVTEDPLNLNPPLKSNAVFIGSFDIDDETMKTKSGNEFISLGGGSYIMVIPLVTEYAYNGYLVGFSDPQYLETLPKTYLPVTELHKGTYRSFETRNDSMDDGTSQAIEHGDTAVGRLISPDLYRNSKLHLKKYPDYIIVTHDGIIVKRITSHNPDTGEITIHSLNPDKDRYPDDTMHLRDIKQLFNVTNVIKSRR